FFQKAGFSIAATAQRDGVRVIAIVMGSKNRKVRDAKAIELLAKGFAMLPSAPEPAVKSVVQEAPPEKKATAVKESVVQEATAPPTTPTKSGGWGKFFLGTVFGFILYGLLNNLVLKKQRRSNRHHRPF
ncbi:MAG: D-alanyl-D-alanine carboxypeptidase, partial [Thermodesulfobacteriota bacterium]